MARASKFTDEQKYEIALDLLAGKMSHAEVCRKWDISSTYAYKLKDRALELLSKGIGKPTGRPSNEQERLKKKVADLEQLAGDQALVIRYLKKKKDTYDSKEYLSGQRNKCSKIRPGFYGACFDSWSLGWAGEREGCQTEILPGFGRRIGTFQGPGFMQQASKSYVWLSSDLGVIASRGPDN